MDELNKLAEDPDLWNDAEKAQSIMKEKTRLEVPINNYRVLDQDINDAVELIEMGEMEGDEEVVAEAEESIRNISEKLEKQKLESMLSGEADSNDTFLEINSGAGGTESQDWAEMLLRMYIRWAENKGYKIEWIDEHKGEEAGIKSACIRIRGHNAYGWLKNEIGVHRLVRISPFDSASRRHTSFASVWIYPVIDEGIEIEIVEKDLRIDTYRASGAGGQHVNTTDSAVRITHVPTNTVVQCQSGRSQHKNKAEALSMLKAKLYELELKKKEEEAGAVNSTKSDNAWGNQIRSYVLHPYQMVKDSRSGLETSDTAGVLDGKLDDFMAGALVNKMVK